MPSTNRLVKETRYGNGSFDGTVVNKDFQQTADCHPAKAYEEAGFKDYALCTWTDKGIFLQPLDVEDEDVTIGILRYLINEGYALATSLTASTSSRGA